MSYIALVKLATKNSNQLNKLIDKVERLEKELIPSADLIDKAQAAKLLGISVRTWDRKYDNILTSRMEGNKKVYLRSAVEEIINKKNQQLYA